MMKSLMISLFALFILITSVYSNGKIKHVFDLLSFMVKRFIVILATFLLFPTYIV